MENELLDDFNLDDEEDTQAENEDELLRYLEDDDEEDESEEGKKKAAEDEEARLQAIVDRKIADRFTNQPVVKAEPKVEPVVSGKSVDEVLDQLADDITDELATDPKKAIRKLLTTSRALSTQSGEGAAARTNRIMIEQYRAKREDDPVFKQVMEDFDKQVEGYTEDQLGKATPAQVRKALSDAEDAAVGRWYRTQAAERSKKRTSAPAPAYGGGNRGGGTRATTTTLSASDRTLIKMAKSANMSEKDIKELLRETRK
jgi:hypothetical protein